MCQPLHSSKVALSQIIVDKSQLFCYIIFQGAVWMEYKVATFAERLSQVMQQKGLTKSALARLCGVDKSSVTRYCNGDYEAKQDVVHRMAAALNISEDWLMGYDAPKAKRPAMAVLNEDSAPYLAEEEMELIRCWRKASFEERENISFLLRKYDMPQPKSREAEKSRMNMPQREV